MNRAWIGTLIGLLLAGPAWAEDSVPVAKPMVSLNFAQGVPANQRRLLRGDLALLPTLGFKDRDGELQRILKLPEVSSVAMQAWLAERVHSIINEDYPVDLTTMQVLKENVLYPDPHVIPQDSASEIRGNQDIVEMGDPDEDDPSQAAPTGTQTLMANVGGLMYLFGKQSQELIGFTIPGIGQVPLISPRVGVISIGKGLFLPLSTDIPVSEIGNRVHSVFRLSTLFHESRHSDGHGKSLLFGHAICPENHSYAGLPACDTPSNGAYRIGALFLRAVKDGCTDCSPGELDRLSLLQLDSEGRMLGPPKSAHSKLENSDFDLCASLKTRNLKADFCATEAEKRAALEWDDAPESL